MTKEQAYQILDDNYIHAQVAQYVITKGIKPTRRLIKLAILAKTNHHLNYNGWNLHINGFVCPWCLLDRTPTKEINSILTPLYNNGNAPQQ